MIHESTRRQPDGLIHEIRLGAHLDSRWSDWLGGLELTRLPDGTTTLIGPIADQAALHGVLNRLRDLGVPLLSVRRVAAGESEGTSK